MCNFQGSWFLALEFPKDLTKTFGISRGGALFCLEFPGGNWKIPGESQKSISLAPSVWFVPGIAHILNGLGEVALQMSGWKLRNWRFKVNLFDF